MPQWYNYRTEKYEEKESPTDETIGDYLPQQPAALALYYLYRNGQLTVLDAMENVLMISIGRKPKNVPTWAKPER